MILKLYDLAAADEERRFSPYCWRIKMALAHKQLDVETIPWRFVEKDAIAFSRQGRVPLLVDGEMTVADSWMIANYLEDRYPDRKSLFGDTSGRAPTRFIASWADGALLPAIAQLILIDVFAHLHEKDKAYFRESREKRLGTTLEKFCANRRNGGPVSQDIARATTARARIAAVPRRYRPNLRRSRPVRRFPVGAFDEPIQAPRTGRPCRQLARTNARPLWQLRAKVCGLSCLSSTSVKSTRRN